MYLLNLKIQAERLSSLHYISKLGYILIGMKWKIEVAAYRWTALCFNNELQIRQVYLFRGLVFQPVVPKGFESSVNASSRGRDAYYNNNNYHSEQVILPFFL